MYMVELQINPIFVCISSILPAVEQFFVSRLLKRALILGIKLHLVHVQRNTKNNEMFWNECFPSRGRYCLNIDTNKKISFFRRCWTQVVVPFAGLTGKQQTRTDRRVFPKKPFSLCNFSFEMDTQWTILWVYYHYISPFIFDIFCIICQDCKNIWLVSP